MKRDLRPSKNSNEISLSQSARNAKNWAKLWKAIETLRKSTNVKYFIPTQKTRKTAKNCFPSLL